MWIFGTPIRVLWLAKNWLRYPPDKPGPGMVAVHVNRDRFHGHVLAIIKVSGKRALVFNPNSGGHKTRIHWVTLAHLKARYSIRNPRGHA
jgi:hypothetical protein